MITSGESWRRVSPSLFIPNKKHIHLYLAVNNVSYRVEGNKSDRLVIVKSCYQQALYGQEPDIHMICMLDQV